VIHAVVVAMIMLVHKLIPKNVGRNLIAVFFRGRGEEFGFTNKTTSNSG
jgi:hypothetical protein